MLANNQRVLDHTIKLKVFKDFFGLIVDKAVLKPKVAFSREIENCDSE